MTTNERTKGKRATPTNSNVVIYFRSVKGVDHVRETLFIIESSFLLDGNAVAKAKVKAKAS